MRVLQLADSDKPPFAAIVAGYTRALRELGCEVEVHYGERFGAKVEDGASYGVLDSFTLATPVDHVIAHRKGAYRVAARLLRSGRALAATTVVHQLNFLEPRARRWHHRFVGRRVQLAAVSGRVAESLRTWAPYVGPIHVLPNPIDAERYDRERLSREDARVHLGLPMDATVVGVVGRLTRSKRPLEALEAFARSLAELPRNARLVFIGEPSGNVALEPQVRERGLEERVHLTGFVPNAARVFAALDILLHPNAEEALGMVMAEAAVAGVPVVTAVAPDPVLPTPACAIHVAPDPAALSAGLLRMANMPEAEREAWSRRNRLDVVERLGLPALRARLAEHLGLPLEPTSEGRMAPAAAPAGVRLA